MIQVAPLLAAQEQPDAVLTWMFPLPACDPRDKLLGATATAHPDAWAIETVWSAIVTEPCRAGPVLEATATCTCPSPVPDAPAEIVSQSAPLVVSQLQPEPALTWMVPVPACDPRDRLLGAIETVHPDAWLIVTDQVGKVNRRGPRHAGGRRHRESHDARAAACTGSDPHPLSVADGRPRAALPRPTVSWPGPPDMRGAHTLSDRRHNRRARD